MGILKKIFGSKKEVRKREGNPDVYNLPNEDERMNWGMQKSRLTLHYFKACLEAPKDGQQYFSVKARIEDNGMVEHIWLMEPSFDDDGNIFGVIGNEPIDVKNVSINEKIGITSQFVSDWMIIENGRLIGGYTIRAIREGFSGVELVNFDKSLGGMQVDDGEDYFLPDFETPEGAIVALEQAYDNDDLEGALNCKNFDKEAEFMLKKTIKMEIDSDLIEKTSEVLKLSFIQNMSENGMPKFNGMKRAFKRHKISDDHYVVSETCYYSDGGRSLQKLNTYKVNGQWKVLGLAE